MLEGSRAEQEERRMTVLTPKRNRCEDVAIPREPRKKEKKTRRRERREKTKQRCEGKETTKMSKQRDVLKEKDQCTGVKQTEASRHTKKQLC